jgi:LAO/AO transport system kinase
MKLLDAFGKDIIFVETVGVGQTELDIMEAVDTVVVVLVPEAGDTIQTMKAGLLEIADVFAVNKADREGADYLVAELEAMLCQNPKHDWWQVPVIATQAVNDVGTQALYQAIERHHQALQQSGMLDLRRRERRKSEFYQTIQNYIMARMARLIEKDGHLSRFLEKVERGEIDPYSASLEILSDKTLLESWLQEMERSD